MNEYSLIKIAKNDPQVPNFLVLALVFIIYGLEISFIGYTWSPKHGINLVVQDDRLKDVIIWGIIALGCLIYVGYRFYTVIDLFGIGIECNGIIENIEFVSKNNRWEITFTYEYKDNNYVNTIRLSVNKETNKFKVSDKITVLADMFDSRKVIIKEFYI